MHLFHAPDAGLPVHIQNAQGEVVLAPGPLRPADPQHSIRLSRRLPQCRVRNSSQQLRTAEFSRNHPRRGSYRTGVAPLAASPSGVRPVSTGSTVSSAQTRQTAVTA